jgi:hypothetical protein
MTPTLQRTCAIVPVKALGQAKRRLAHVLPEAARRRLVLAMRTCWRPSPRSRPSMRSSW